MIDTHCHLDRVRDLDAALDNDLRAMVSVGTDPERSERCVQMAETIDRVWATVGLHPTEAASIHDPEVRARIEALADHPRVVAIGETGIDLYWDTATLADQLEALAWQVGVAARVGKPVVFHVRDRDARDEASLAAARAIRDLGYARGILHCTNAHPELLETGLDAGWYVSFAGNLTYPKATLLHAAARTVREDRLLVETDSPYLAPIPHRGKANVPGNVHLTAAALAHHRGMGAGALEAILDANAAAVYGLSSPP